MADIRTRELHVFRGHQPSPTGFIMGHEFTGVVTDIGSQVTAVQIGDKIISPFTTSWYDQSLLAHIPLPTELTTSKAPNASTASTASHPAAPTPSSSAPLPLTVAKLSMSASRLPTVQS
jgi:NADPH:quinone reductase-like Zn-dependent oxidoreductase